MSCGGSYGGGNYGSTGVSPSQTTGQCVTDVVRNIVKAQHRAVEAEEDTCLTSCDRSIMDLLDDFEPNRRRLRFNTIPFMLYCSETCKPFVGTGFIRRGGKFTCLESPVFRVKNFVRGSNHCALLEILTPVHGEHDGDAGEGDFCEGEDSGCCASCVCKPYKQGRVENFRATGICITVDLRCFCGITCLDPINPLRPIGGRYDY